jgi:hypothetical protein
MTTSHLVEPGAGHDLPATYGGTLDTAYPSIGQVTIAATHARFDRNADLRFTTWAGNSIVFAARPATRSPPSSTAATSRTAHRAVAGSPRTILQHHASPTPAGAGTERVDIAGIHRSARMRGW